MMVNINYCCDPNDANNQNALHLLCINNKKNLLDCILDILKHPNININIKDSNGDSAIILACKNYQGYDLDRIIQVLLRKDKTQVNNVDENGDNIILRVVCNKTWPLTFKNVIDALSENGIQVTNEGNNIFQLLTDNNSIPELAKECVIRKLQLRRNTTV